MQLEGRNISFRYEKDGDWILDNIDFSIQEGDRIALVGSSGCGKSTLARILAGYFPPDKGEVLYDGKQLPKRGFSPIQMIHQHPEQSVNPRHRMARILNEAWTPDATLLKEMGIRQDWLSRWPSELSGGELQRFCIARVLSPQTKFLICDEITTMLDVITQAQIWNMVLEVAERANLGLLVITHNPWLAERVCTKSINMDCQAG